VASSFLDSVLGLIFGVDPLSVGAAVVVSMLVIVALVAAGPLMQISFVVF
jgi:hypothetical protein